MKKICTVVGARPQFVKAGVVSKALSELPKNSVSEVLIHTGQHFSVNMSDIFFRDFELSEPSYNLGIASLSHGAMTGRMLESIERILISESPDGVLIYGDTNSTLAGALAAAKLHIPVCHVEAGIRSYNMRMPEEVNRILSDQVSSLLLCPSKVAEANLQKENVSGAIYNVGDVMFDATRLFATKNTTRAFEIIAKPADGYVLCTVHRAENTDDVQRLSGIFEALAEISQRTDIVLPLHPRTQACLERCNLTHLTDSIKIIEPLNYSEMLYLQRGASVVITDSGGLQKEAYFNGVPCITLRDETEWPETVDMGWNKLVGAERQKIVNAWSSLDSFEKSVVELPYGDGHAGEKIANLVWNVL